MLITGDWKGFFLQLSLQISCFIASGYCQIVVPSNGHGRNKTPKLNSPQAPEGGWGSGGDDGLETVFIHLDLFAAKPMIQWICFGRCLLMDVLAADDGSSVRDEETKRLKLSVSKQWPGLCFRKVKHQSEKGDLHVPECCLRKRKSW